MMAGWTSQRVRRVRSALALALVGAALSGCVEPMPQVQVGRGDIRNAIAKGQLTSPRAATVALVSLEGAPDGVEARFRQALATQAASREIAITDAASARYLVRGYLSAYPSEHGVTVAYTYDLFDAGSKLRRERVADEVDLPAVGGDPWAALTDTALTSLVGHSADDLAVALAGTPEAQAAAGHVASAATTVQ